MSTQSSSVFLSNHTYRYGKVLILLLAVMFILSACGNDKQQNNLSPSSTPDSHTEQPQQNTTQGSAEQSLTVTHDYGKTEVPAHPKKIVSIGMEDILLTLDAPLVQAFSTDGYYLDKEIKQRGIAVNSSFDINLEAIMEANPDLIVINKYMTDEAGYEQLSKIAPTIAYIRDDWKHGLTELGKILDKEQEANAAFEQFNKKLADAKDRIIKTIGDQKTVAFVRPAKDAVELDFPDSAWIGIIYNDLGLLPDSKVLELQKNSNDTWGGTMISLETLPELTADYLFADYGASMASEEVFQNDLAKRTEIENMEIWKAIPAVKNNESHIVSARHWALSGPIADSLKIDDVVRAIIGQ